VANLCNRKWFCAANAPSYNSPILGHVQLRLALTGTLSQRFAVMTALSAKPEALQLC